MVKLFSGLIASHNTGKNEERVFFWLNLFEPKHPFLPFYASNVLSQKMLTRDKYYKNY